jgi:hypothetical protein
MNKLLAALAAALFGPITLTTCGTTPAQSNILVEVTPNHGFLIDDITNKLCGSPTTGAWSIAAADIAEIRLAEGGTMTKPIETVRVVTNTAHWNNEERVPHGDTWCIGTPAPGSVIKEMTERTETTTVVEVKTLRFTWDGEDYTAKRERVLSRKVKRWARKSNWVEE